MCELGPAEELGVRVVNIAGSADISLECLSGGMDASPNLLVGDQSEEAFGLVDPGGTGGGEWTRQRGRLASQFRMSLVL